jgi:hypothetical protein
VIMDAIKFQWQLPFFPLQVAVKLRRDGAARDLWAALQELPAQALLSKTNLLHSVLDLVGAPVSQADVGKFIMRCVRSQLQLLQWFLLCGRCRSLGPASPHRAAVAGEAGAQVPRRLPGADGRISGLPHPS